MSLSSPQIGRIHTVILAAYTRDELERVLFTAMDVVFDHIVANKDFSAQVFSLLIWANERNRLLELLSCLREERPGNERLKALYDEIVLINAATKITAEKLTAPIDSDRREVALPVTQAVQGYSEVLAKVVQPFYAEWVTISADLSYSAVTDKAFEQIQSIAPRWVQSDRRNWVGLAPNAVTEAFDQKNRERMKDASLGVLTERATTPVIRLIAPPRVEHKTLHLLVAPISWDLYSVTIPYPFSTSTEVHGNYVPDHRLLDSVDAFMRKFPDRHPSDFTESRAVGPRNRTPLGLEALVRTSDNYVLLRLRAITSLVGSSVWDVSFSGYARFDTKYCVNAPNDDSDAIEGIFPVDLTRWLAKEFFRETGVDTHDAINLEKAFVLGVHRNRDSGAYDLMTYLEIDVNAEEMARHLYLDHQLEIERHRALVRGRAWTPMEEASRMGELVKEFKESRYLLNSKSVPELEVAKTQNWFIEFTPDGVEEFLRAITSRGQSILPEALCTLAMAVHKEYGISLGSPVNVGR